MFPYAGEREQTEYICSNLKICFESANQSKRKIFVRFFNFNVGGKIHDMRGPNESHIIRKGLSSPVSLILITEKEAWGDWIQKVAVARMFNNCCGFEKVVMKFHSSYF